ncbi:MAG: glucose dehydrogenase, partial [Proteobacteria bacterium]|nr:glucose dehydrogenase [Pseudomonadota bacterium]
TFISEFQTGVLKEKVLLQIEQPFSNHNGGHLAFDKEGYLYIGTGDGGSAGDPLNHSQNLNSLLGKMVRIGVDSKGLYDIPKDNPLTSPQQRKEIFAWGLRNPWRFSFDRETGALFAGDVGQDRYEEIDLVEKGKNYGWRVMEADHCLTPPRGCNREGYVMPLTEYGRSEGGSVTGGYVYRGKQLPDLKGVYIYGDFMSGNIWGLSYDQASRKVLQNRLLLKSKLSVASFAEDADGELYVVDYSGVIYRLAPGL